MIWMMFVHRGDACLCLLKRLASVARAKARFSARAECLHRKKFLALWAILGVLIFN